MTEHGLANDVSRSAAGDSSLLETIDLKRYYPVRSPLLKRRVGWIKAVDGVTLLVSAGETLGLVGESGCGKSTLGKTLVGIYRPTGGEVRFTGQRVSRLSRRKLRGFGRHVQYLHQNPALCLDPWWRVGRSVGEPLAVHCRRLSRKDTDERVRRIFEAVGLDHESISRYPHEFSGGQQRRIGLARMLILEPRLIIFDEPTSGLDVSVQASILQLMERLKGEHGLTYMHISHNLAVVNAISTRISVMYLGKVVEVADTGTIIDTPLHPYTRMLFSSVPRITTNGKSPETRSRVLGEPPDPQTPPSGCRFHTRCHEAEEMCMKTEPELREVVPGHFVACHMTDWGVSERSLPDLDDHALEATDCGGSSV